MGWPQFPAWLFSPELLAVWRGGLRTCWQPGAGAAFRMSAQHPQSALIWSPSGGNLQSGKEKCLLYHPNWSPVGHVRGSSTAAKGIELEGGGSG